MINILVPEKVNLKKKRSFYGKTKAMLKNRRFLVQGFQNRRFLFQGFMCVRTDRYYIEFYNRIVNN
jgi:hypothetical protein